MRPVRLSLEGFACFATRQEVDFDGLDLFAISGSTGAGKSSLLDAMVFALYGRIPRLATGYKDVLTLGKDRLVVTLEFAASGKRFRVARSLRRGRSAEAVLEEVLPEGAPRAMASGSDAVSDGVRDLLGLPYEAFIQSALLPQGEFARFLQSPARDRRRILRELLALEHYEDMRQRAEKGKAELSGARGKLEARLTGELAHATDEAVEEAQRRVRELADATITTARELEAAQGVQAVVARAYDDGAQLRTLRATITRLTDETAHTTTTLDDIQRAVRADAVCALLSAMTDAARSVGAVEEELRQVTEEFEDARRGEQSALEASTTADRDASALAGLEVRVAALDAVRGWLSTRQRAWERLFALRRERATQADEQRARRADLVAAEADAHRAAEQATATALTLERLRGTVEQRDELEPLWRTAQEEMHARAAWEAAQRGAQEGQARFASAQARQRTVEDDVEQAERSVAAAQDALGDAEHAREQARRADAAHALRSTLTDGEPCPVCGQQVNGLPPAPDGQPHAVFDDLVRAAQEKARGAQRVLDEVRAALSAAAAALAAAEASLSERGTVATHAREALVELEERLGGRSAAVVQREWERLQAGLVELRAAEAGHAAATRAAEEARHAAARAHLSAEHAAQREATLQRDEETARHEHAQASAEIARVTAREDVEAERQEMADRLEGLRQSVAARREALARAQALREGAQQRRRFLEDRLARARNDEERARERADAGARRQGFTSAEEASTALMDGEELQRLRDAVLRRDAALSDARRREQELVDKGARTVSEDELRDATARVEAARSRMETLLVQRGSEEEKARELSASVERARSLRLELAAVTADHDVHAQLADDLRSDRFQSFVLQETFEALVAGASDRLFALTGRYGLAADKDDFVVVDHDHARQTRPADTLSGGETFLASLALALELSDQVQRAQGATSLDSLFIDEGFGALDPEMLDSAAAALESLQSGGRMVGVVSHLPELSARLPARLHVEKGPDGARVRRG